MKKSVQFNKPPHEVLRDRRQQETKEKMDRLKQPRQPHGGALPVKVPPLNAEPLKTGGSMAEQADILRDPTSPLSPTYSPELAMMNRKEAEAAKPGGPFSLVDENAVQQPGFRPGIGSMYQGNQPALMAQKQQEKQEQSYKPQLSDETRQTMQTLAEFQAVAERRQTMPNDEPEGQTTEAAKAEELNKELDGDAEMFRELREVLDDPTQWNLLNNPKRRKGVEGRLSPMDITDVILHGEVRQTIPIVPGKLDVTYRSVSGDEDLAVKQMMFGESGGDRYLMDKYTIMQLALALVSINGEELPSHLNDKKKFDETKFISKFEKVTRFPVQLIADLGIQYLWFDERVRTLFLGGTDELKNS